MKTVVNFAPTGIVPTREMTPYVPLTAEEICKDVDRACGIGITMVHLHVRDENLKPTLSPETYRKVIRGIRAKHPDLVVCVSLSGRFGESVEHRCSPLCLSGEDKPDMASLTLGSLNFNKEASVNSPSTIRTIAEAMLAAGVVPELEIFDSGMVNYMKYLASKGLIRPPFYTNLILGNVACSQATPLHLGVLMADLPADTIWSAGGVGDFQLVANAMSVAAGGGVRVGLEDNIWRDTGRTVLATNTDIVFRAVSLSMIHQREIMTPSEFRTAMGMKKDGYGRDPA